MALDKSNKCSSALSDDRISPTSGATAASGATVGTTVGTTVGAIGDGSFLWLLVFRTGVSTFFAEGGIALLAGDTAVGFVAENIELDVVVVGELGAIEADGIGSLQLHC